MIINIHPSKHIYIHGKGNSGRDCHSSEIAIALNLALVYLHEIIYVSFVAMFKVESE